jgi:hypothetical protein
MLAWVSPQSRGRKSSKPVRRQASSRAASSASRPREPEFRDGRDVIVKNLAVLADVAAVPSAYDAEALVSVLVGYLIQAGVPQPGLTRMMLDVIDELRRRDADHSYPALRALAVIGPPGVAEYAAVAAGRLAARDAALPWIASIGDVTAGTCHLAANAAGDTTLVSCEFTYADGSKPHAVWAVLDAAWHGVPACLMLADDLPEARASLASNAKIAGAEVREVPAAEAAPVVLAAIDALILHGPPPERDRKDDSFSMACASLSMARHRAELLLGPDGKPPARDPVEDHWPAAARDQLAEEFLASPHATEFTDTASRTIPRLLITRSLDTLGCDPTAASPAALGRILLYMLPSTLAAPDRYGNLIPPVARAWMEWLMDRRALDKPARRQIRRQLDATLRRFPAVWNGPLQSPRRRYVQDLPDEVICDGTKLVPVLERREFAVPVLSDRASGTVAGKPGRRARDVTTLDPADPVDRQLITVNDLSARMISQHSFGNYVTVVEQLWAGNPAELWSTAKRMLDAGLSREAVLDRLARAATP